MSIPATPPTKLTLIRHAEVEARYQSVFGGRIDMEISPRGHEQAAMLAEFLRGKHFDAIYASPMKRVQQTLAPCLKNGVPAPKLMDGLREVDFGDWTGCTWDGVREKFGFSAFTWLEQLERGTIPNAESVPAYRARVEPCLREALDNNPGKSVAVFCHGGVIRMILAILLELPLSRMSAFDVDYTGVTEIDWQPHRMEIQFLNITPWRDMVKP